MYANGSMQAPFASLKKQAEILFRLICCERKKQAEKTDYKKNKQGLYIKGKQ